MSYIKEKLELEIEQAELKAQMKLLSLPPLQRWLLIGSIIILIPSYFITKSLSHAYWSGRYSERLIAAKPSFDHAEPIAIGKSHISVYGTNTYSAAIEVQNKNPELSLKEIPLTVHLLNKQGEAVYSEQKKLFLLPNEKKFIVLPRVSSPEELVSAAVTMPETIHWQKRLNLPKVTIRTSQPRFMNTVSPVAFEVQGNFTNQSPFRIQNVRLNVILYSDEGKILAASLHEAQSVAPLETRDYRLIWPGVFSENVAVVEVIPEVNTLNLENLTLPEGAENSSGNLGRPENDTWF